MLLLPARNDQRVIMRVVRKAVQLPQSALVGVYTHRAHGDVYSFPLQSGRDRIEKGKPRIFSYFPSLMERHRFLLHHLLIPDLSENILIADDAPNVSLRVGYHYRAYLVLKHQVDDIPNIGACIDSDRLRLHHLT